MSAKITLKRYLHDKQIELYEVVDRLRVKMIESEITNQELLDLTIYETQLDIVNEIIAICKDRGRY